MPVLDPGALVQPVGLVYEQGLPLPYRPGAGHMDWAPVALGEDMGDGAKMVV